MHEHNELQAAGDIFLIIIGSHLNVFFVTGPTGFVPQFRTLSPVYFYLEN